MEIGKDLLISLRDQVRSPAHVAGAGRCDWAVLRARLHAAHAVGGALIAGASGKPRAAGAFASLLPDASKVRTQASRDVNRTDLADDKARGGKAVRPADNRLDSGQGKP